MLQYLHNVRDFVDGVLVGFVVTYIWQNWSTVQSDVKQVTASV